MQIRLLVVSAVAGAGLCSSVFAADPPPPQIIGVGSSNAQKTINWTPYPAAQQYNILSTPNLGGALTNDGSGKISGYTWNASNAAPAKFYKLGVTPMTSNAVLTATVLNRLAYGPTPDELERVTAIGPQAYINEQLAPDSVADSFDSYVSVVTNGVSLPPNTNWTSLSVTGRFTSTNIYMYMTVVGDVYIDNVQLRPIYYSNVVQVVGTNTVTITLVGGYGPTLVANGDFESALSGPWHVSPNLSGSSISSTVVCSGNGSLHLVASAPGSTLTSAIYQGMAAAQSLTNNTPVILSYDYLPNATSSRLTVRLSSSGVVSSADDQPDPPTWVYVTQTGSATTSNLYIYITGIPAGVTGAVYLDDIKLVAGSVAEAGPNLVRNGGFESPLVPTDWNLASNMLGSVISSTVSHSGGGSLLALASTSGSTFSSAIVQSNIAGVIISNIYTVSFWYSPGRYPVTVRLSGSGINSTPDAGNYPPGLRRRLDLSQGSLQDLRSWFCLNAVGSRRQLLEILDQFFENHFVTEYSKSADYLDGFYDDGGLIQRIAAGWEYRENSKWRACLMRPDCTLYDLLKISAESPAMIVYLDTVSSRGDGNNVANENYAREILELFT